MNTYKVTNPMGQTTEFAAEWFRPGDTHGEQPGPWWNDGILRFYRRRTDEESETHDWAVLIGSVPPGAWIRVEQVYPVAEQKGWQVGEMACTCGASIPLYAPPCPECGTDKLASFG